MNTQSMSAKIRALLDKTVENGATEEEALAAAQKAHELLEKYQLELGEVDVRKEGVIKALTPILMTSSGLKLHKGLKLKWHLSSSIAKFCDCKVWGSGSNDIVVLGLPSDVEFFMWLLDSLTLFTMAETDRYMAKCEIFGSGPRWQARKAFTMGCTSRIARRLMDLRRESDQAHASDGRALVVLKNQLVTEEFAKLDLKLRRTGGRRTFRDGGAFGAGQQAGDRAGFGRPVNGGNGTKLLS